MRTLAIANHKGGTGKTTTAAALAEQIARPARRVLLVDADPQASLTQGLGIRPDGGTLADVIGTRPRRMAEIIRPVSPALDIAPAGIELAAAELALVQQIGRERVIARALEGLDYALAIIDTPPALSLLTVAALAAADAVIVPTLPAAADLRGVRLFLETIEQVRELRPALALLGVLVTQYDGRTTAHRDALAEIERAGLDVIGIIPRGIKAQEAAAAAQPVTAYAPGSKPAAAYQDVSRKVIQWLKRQP